MKKWDKYYYEMCNTVAKNSSCLSRKVGAIIVRDKSIISTGYNGPPRGIPHCDTRITTDSNIIEKFTDAPYILGVCPRKQLGYPSGEGLHLCIAGHAERNALINAARNGVSVRGTTMYMDCPVPCKDCLIEIINAGIEEIVVTEISYYDDMSEFLVKNSNLKVRTYGTFR